MKRWIALAAIALLTGTSSGCCCLGPLFGMPYGGYYGGGGCQPCGGSPYGMQSYPASPCGPNGCGNGAYAPVGANAFYGSSYQTSMQSAPLQTTMLNPLPVW